jgi:FAD synthase
MFGEAMQLAVAIRILRDALGNIGLNPTISSAQNRATWEEMLTDFEGRLYGGYIENIGYQRGILDNLSLDFSELDAVCLKSVDDRITEVKW